MAQAQLQVTLRESSGKGVARKCRAAGQVPGVVYGKGIDSCPISIDPKALEKAISTKAGWNTLLTLKTEGALDGKVVILKDLTMHPIKRNTMHVDFQTVNMKQNVSIMVPVVTTGTPVGVKEGGNLQIIRHELEVHCLPTAIPDQIELDVAHLTIGDTIHIDDVKLPEGVEVPHDVNFTVVTCAGFKPEVEEVEGEEVEEGAEEATEE